MQTARLNERTPFSAHVDVVPHGGPGALAVWCQDLSETGMFVQTTQAFAVGDLLSLRFEVDGIAVHIRAAEVVWVRRFEPINVDGRLPGLGLRFVSVDPPARAALRRVVQRAIAGKGDLLQASLSRVPKPPPMPQSLPEPTLTLPPLSRSIIEAAGGRDLEDTQDLLPPAAIQRTPPGGLTFSMLPFRALDVSLPPDEPNLSAEARVFDGVPDTPRAVTMAPTRARAPNPRAVTMGPQPASTGMSSSGASPASPFSGPSLASAPPRQAVTQKMFTLPPTEAADRVAPASLVPGQLATMSIIQTLPPAAAGVQALMGLDDSPSAAAEPSGSDLPAPGDVDPFAGWFFAKVAVTPALKASTTDDVVAMAMAVPFNDGEIENPSILEMTSEPPTLVPSLLPHNAVAEVSDGYSLGPAGDETPVSVPTLHAPQQRAVAVRHLSVGDLSKEARPVRDLTDEQRPGRVPARRRRSAFGPAVAVLALGCAAGAAVALFPGAIPSMRPTAPAAIVIAAAPIVEVAPVVAPVAPQPLPVHLAEGVLMPTTAAVAAPVDVAPVNVSPVEAVLAVPVAVADEKREEKVAKVAKVERTDKVAVAAEEPVLASSTRAANAAAAAKAVIAGGRHEVRLPRGGSLRKVFALGSPARVVVDLEGARLPGAPADVGDDGVSAVRFGQPSPETQRVVVVLDGADKPDAVDARLDGDTLVVSWQH